MRHLTAARKGDGGWHYVSLGRTGGYPLGYCAEHEPHATEAEARECYARYQRDHIKFDRGTWSWTGCNAEGCDNPTRSAARCGAYKMVALCDEHLTTEHAIKALRLDEPAGDAWQS